MKGYLFLIRMLGVRGAWRYERDRRAGMTINYADAFSPDELAVIGEHFSPAPWERRP